MDSLILVALDVDGTLVDLAGAGARAMDRAFCQLLDLERSPRRGTFAGRTDLGVVLEVLGEHAKECREVRLDEKGLQRFFSIYLDHLAEEIVSTPYSATPGAKAFIESLWCAPNTRVGLATGNIRDAALLKLDVSGLRTKYDFGAFGGEHELRDRLFAAAFAKAEATLPAGETVSRRVVVGDTPQDILGARAVGAQVVAVAQGPFERDELGRHDPDLLVTDLSEAFPNSIWS